VNRRARCHRLNRLACAAIRYRLRFLTDRRRRFMMTSAALLTHRMRGKECQIAGDNAFHALCSGG
jgi:hypothetical protein